jgi:hypothetical protein
MTVGFRLLPDCYRENAMSDTVQSPLSSLGQRFIKLPRELRDLVYFYIVYDEDDTPLELTRSDFQVPLSHSTISAEWLEAAYTHRVCRVTFSDPKLLRDGSIKDNIWGPYPQHKHCIRRLIVNTPEASIVGASVFGNDPEDLEHKCTFTQPEVRQEWNELLSLPRLEYLKIELQKSAPDAFTWSNFGPILYQLREQLPKLCIELFISFDEILEHSWNAHLSLNPESEDWNTQEDPYLPMGFVDASVLIEQPNSEDRAYVEEYLAGSTNAESRDAVRGLLDETPAHRRILAGAYVVKEPALLRVLMAERYEIYKSVRSRTEQAKTGGLEKSNLLRA